jgi:general secretion pathway protein A
VLCDSALVYGFADELETIDTDILENVYEELKALGTFTDYDARPSADPLPPKPVAAAASTLEPRIELLEGKVQLLDHEIDGIKEKLDLLAHKRNERDDIIIELFKMLKDNLDNRMQLLNRFDIANNNLVRNEDDDHDNKINMLNSPKVSKLSKHKKKKK